MSHITYGKSSYIKYVATKQSTEMIYVIINEIRKTIRTVRMNIGMNRQFEII